MMNFSGGSGMDMVALCSGLVDLLEEGAAQNRPVRAIIGEDPAFFCDELIRNVRTWPDKIRENLNYDIRKYLDKADDSAQRKTEENQ